MLYVGHYQQHVSFLKGKVQIGEEYLVAPFHPGHHQMVGILFAHDIVEGLSEEGGILHPAGKTIGAGLVAFRLGGLLFFLVDVDLEKGFGKQQDADCAQHAKGIGHGVGGCYACGSCRDFV